MLEFIVKDGREQWPARVTRLEKHNSVYEIHIESRSGIDLILGEYSSGWFVCLPVWDYGTGLSPDLTDTFYNYEKLQKGLGEVDARTVAVVLKEISAIVE